MKTAYVGTVQILVAATCQEEALEVIAEVMHNARETAHSQSKVPGVLDWAYLSQGQTAILPAETRINETWLHHGYGCNPDNVLPF